MSNLRADLPITAVAERTSLTAAVLRSWEQRYGFPQPERQPGGHRRYTERHVEQVNHVIRLRDGGMSLPAAIHEVAARPHGAQPSIFAEVRRRWPDQPVEVLSKRGMHAISRAIEDECLAQADHPVLIGAFQRERYYRQSESRWRELARTARATVVFADFAVDAEASGPPVEIALAHNSVLHREWAVVCDGPYSAACLLGVERSRQLRGGPRLFEAIWSVDPDLVHDAACIGAALAGDSYPQSAVPPALASPDRASNLLRATTITNRAIAYLDR